MPELDEHGYITDEKYYKYSKVAEIPKGTSKGARYLKGISTHFMMRDWEYTRNHDVKVIKHSPERLYDTRSYRLKRAWDRLIHPLKDPLGLASKQPKWKRALMSWRMIPYTLRRYNDLPDGALDKGGILTYWEETGEYLQVVQPTVGSLVADFLIEEPENPHAIAINAEIERIVKDYSKRIKAERQK